MVKAISRSGMVKAISVIIAFSIVLMVTSVNVLAEVPEGAIEVTGYSTRFWYYLDSVTSPNGFDFASYKRINTQTLSISGLNSTTYTWIFPFFALQDTSGQRLNLTEGVTYHVTLNVTSMNSFNNLTSNVIMASTSSNMTSLDPSAGYTYNLTDLIGSNNVSISIENGTPYAIIDIVFYVPASSLPTVSLPYFGPMIYHVGSSFTISYASITGYIDQNRSVFETLVNQQLADVISILEKNAEQNHEDLTNIWNELKDDGEGDSYDPTVENAVGNLSASEDDVNNLISNKSIIIDGNTTITVDGNVYSQIDAYVNNLPNAESYDLRVGTLINRVFNEFASYLAVVMVLSLSVGLGVTWLSNKEVSR